ncbi:hypothetical protein [Streptomyces sp. CBMA152]|uniref:hypothetical protein n=1 Tax=Streptomyces sp. CBMA152 TaxID=1896312 RepID=UPI00166081E6|nr:hypothetical protein [Streptomyces sp. CBMA152]MBD0741521.1 hypothetical protein [Streptomyces sp. CBMA152]
MRRTTRHTAILLAAAAAALCAPVPAQAADSPTAPAPTDYTVAQQVLRSDQVHDTVSRFLAAAEHIAPAASADGGTAGTPHSLAQTTTTAHGFDLKKPVPLYELASEFVTGKTKPTAGSALRLAYPTSRVSATNGHQAAVLLAPGQSGHTWQLAGIRDGDADISVAERGTDQAQTFMEPQIHAWYRLTRSGTVEPLNKEATVALQAKSHVSLAAYQQLVTKRYSDKLPGSAYDRKGLVGGYAPAEDQPATTTTATTAPTRPWLPAASGAAALAAATAALIHLRRRHRSA